MTPDAAGRPERSDLTVDQHRMVAPSRVWLMPPPGDPTWYAGSWKSNPLTVVVGDVPYVPESEVLRLRAEVEASAKAVEALREAAQDMINEVGRRRVHMALKDTNILWHIRILRELLAARKEEG